MRADTNLAIEKFYFSIFSCPFRPYLLCNQRKPLSLQLPQSILRGHQRPVRCPDCKRRMFCFIVSRVFLVKQTATGKYALFFFFRKPCHTHITVIRQLQRQISIKQLVARLPDPSVLLQQLFHDPVCLHRLFRPLRGKRNSVCISSPCIDHLRNGSNLFSRRKNQKMDDRILKTGISCRKPDLFKQASTIQLRPRSLPARAAFIQKRS